MNQPHAPEHCKRAERLILLIRAMQLLSSGMNLAQQQLQAGSLKPSSTVKKGENNLHRQIASRKKNSSLHFKSPMSRSESKEKKSIENDFQFLSFRPFHFSLAVLSTMNSKYRTTLNESKKLNSSGLLQKATANHITADKLLYEHAIQMVSDSSKKTFLSSDLQLISVIELSTGDIDFKFQFFFHFSPFHSVSLPLSMSYLEILRNVSIGIRQRRSFYTRWHKSVLIRTIKSYWVDVSWIPDFFERFRETRHAMTRSYDSMSSVLHWTLNKKFPN